MFTSGSRNQDSRSAISDVHAKRVENRYIDGFRFAVGDDNNVIGHDRNIRLSPAHDGRDVNWYLLFFLGSILTKNDSLAWRGSWIRILGQRNSLTKRHSFLERERAGCPHFTRDEEDVKRRNLDDIAGFDPDVFAEPASQQPVEIGFFHVVHGLSIVWAWAVIDCPYSFMNDESRRSVCRIESAGN